VSIVERAKELAHRAHAGQVDKAGRPYIEHVARVAAAVSDEPEAEAVAWLHDVLEDCPKFHNEFWAMPAAVTKHVHYLTRVAGWKDGDYYSRIREHRIALRVKLADIADNANEERLAMLDDKTAARLRRKYAKALKALTEREAG
jgi:(p)ppGpp synthase/HD superfamily hydrolase